MMTGIGIDIISLSKIGDLWHRHGRRLEEDILTPRERAHLANINEDSAGPEAAAQRRIRYLASRFAAKEAAVKALHAPHRVAYNWNEIEVTGDIGIAIVLFGRLGHLAKTLKCTRLTGSVDSGETVCMAFVLGETL